MLQCLKALSDWDPEYAAQFEKEINKHLADEAGVELDTFLSAKSIIFMDGWFGTHSDQDYAEEGHKITKAQASKIIDSARNFRFESIEYYNPDYDSVDTSEDECAPNVEIRGSVIYNEVWSWYDKIYGR